LLGVRSTAITEVDVENFIKDQKRRGVKNSTLWHYVKDLRALLLGDEKPRAQEALRQIQSSIRRGPGLNPRTEE